MEVPQNALQSDLPTEEDGALIAQPPAADLRRFKGERNKGVRNILARRLGSFGGSGMNRKERRRLAATMTRNIQKAQRSK